MPTEMPVRQERSPRPSVRIVCLHALLATAIIGTIVATIVWAYS
jgi:hypothetical protein